jgi:ATP-binding cassette subfamily B protein
LQRATASINRITELRQEQPTILDGAGVDFPEGALAVEFDQVSFHYEDDADTHVLNALSFNLKPGMVLGLLGRTGSGKSTLTKLLFRFYDPTVGAIRLGNGQGQMFDIRQARQVELRQHIGMVTQEVQLFQATVRQNLTLFDDTVSDGRIMQVVEDVGLNEWLVALPYGLDTSLEAGGGSLSAGEAQLLAFARVFLADPGLVILDEASSRLDPATEQRMEKAINKLLTNRTGIIIAHRLDTVQRADEIMILDNGQIAEHGPCPELASNPQSRFYSLLQTGLEEAMA